MPYEINALDTDNDDLDISSNIQVFTYTTDANEWQTCRLNISIGDGTKNLTAAGGAFTLTLIVGGQTVEPGPQTVTFGPNARSRVYTTTFDAGPGETVVAQVSSPNTDSDVDVTAVLLDLATPDGYSGSYS